MSLTSSRCSTHFIDWLTDFPYGVLQLPREVMSLHVPLLAT